MNTEIPHLKIERLANGCIRLENEACGDGYIVDIHPIHLRYMAERLGLVREMSASEADALRTVDKLARRLRVLHARIDEMDDYLLNNSDHDHADLSWEVQFSRATYDLSSEFVREIEESGAVITPLRSPLQNTPENGGVEDPRKRAAFSGNQTGAQLNLEAAT